MKKFLLSLAAGVLCAGSALADANVVIAEIAPFKDYTATTALTEANQNLTFGGGDFSFTVAKMAGSTDPSYNFKGKDLRVYAKGTFTITATNPMTKVVFNISTQGLKRLTAITASDGTIAAQAAGDATVTWTGSATTVTFTVGEKAIYGSDGADKGGQFDFTSFEITGGGQLGGGDTPGPGVEPAGEGTEASPYNVAKALDLIQSGATDEADVYVKGKIATITEVNTTYGNATYGISDDGTVAKQLTIYRGLYLNGEKFTAANQLEVGAEVVVLGKLTEYNGSPQMAQGSKLVTYNGGGVTPPPTPGDKGTKEDPYLCADLIALGADASVTDVWFKGYIVGFLNGKIEAPVFGVEGAVATNLLVGPSADCTTVGMCVPVQLPSGAIRSALNLVDHPDNFGKEVLLRGDIAKYFTVPGFKNTKEYELIGGGITPPPTPDKVDFIQASSITSGTEYVLVVDSKVATPIAQSASYGRLNLADVTIASGMLSTEITNAITITAEGSGYTLKDTYGRYLGFDGTHTTSFQLYQAVDATCIWDIAFTNGEAVITLTANEVTGTIGVTKSNQGEWYTNVAPSVGATEIKLPTLYARNSSAVDNITVADENAPVEYFNLQGVRVENPTSGLYIRRQGNSVTKVYVR